MSNEHAETLNRLFEDGYTIQIEFGSFVTGNVAMIKRACDKDNDEWYYQDEHFDDNLNSPRLLKEVMLNEVKVFARMDWLELLPSDYYKELLGMGPELQSLQDWNQDLDNAYDEAGD
jgi:hypothetical protein